VTDRSISLILDASAIVAYTRPSIHVGEVLAEVEDGGNAAALPVASLVEAAATVVPQDRDRLHMLADHDTVVVLPEDAELWPMLAATYSIVGRYDAAAAAVAALRFDVAILTRLPGLYEGVNSGGLVIPIED
jgi:hypothetical protein